MNPTDRENEVVRDGSRKGEKEQVGLINYGQLVIGFLCF